MTRRITADLCKISNPRPTVRKAFPDLLQEKCKVENESPSWAVRDVFTANDSNALGQPFLMVFMYGLKHASMKSLTEGEVELDGRQLRRRNVICWPTHLQRRTLSFRRRLALLWHRSERRGLSCSGNGLGGGEPSSSAITLAM
jgi:hypothetical protein